MKVINLYFLFFLVVCFSTNAQTNKLQINAGINMPKDSIATKALLASVNGFLAAAEENSENSWILANESVETQLLIDEIWDITKSEKFKNDAFYKAYLTRITPLENSNYAISIAYIGINENLAQLRANFELIAHKSNDKYLISSPLKFNTQNWKTQKYQNHIFHYPDTLLLDQVEEYARLTAFYDEKLNVNDGESHYYLGQDDTNPLKLFGVVYKSDYNGKEINTAWAASIDKKSILVLNDTSFYHFDQHDLWHNRLRQVISRKEVHRRVDCHIATLYGGLWGFSWEELFPLFYEKFVVNNKVDWLDHKKQNAHFTTNGMRGIRKNYTDDFIGALLIKKIEQEKGFDSVWKLLKTKRSKEEVEYFAVLEELTGISKKNYNKEVTKLIKNEMKNFK